MKAVDKGKLDVVELLLSKGADMKGNKVGAFSTLDGRPCGV